jgi:uncharacterized membrane protein
MPQVQKDLVARIKNIKQGRLGCHGIPERCFSFKGRTMPFCARCFGASVGHIVFLIFLIRGTTPSILLSAALLLVMLLDWSLQQYFGVTSTNLRRVVTGFCGGLGVASLLFSFFLFIISTLGFKLEL